MSKETNDKVAVLGLGIVGSRVCARLREAGRNVACWNRTPKGLPGEVGSPSAAVDEASVVSLYLKDAAAVREVAASAEPGFSAGTIVLNHATIDLETTLWLDAWCAERGLRFLDAPFTGSREAAAAGELVYYIGGDPDLAAEVDGFLSHSSRSRLACGGVGAATVIKLATNLVSACTVQALAESMAITTSHGVDPACFVRAVAESASGSKLSAMKLPPMVDGKFDTHFSLANMAKDTRYMTAMAEAAGIDAPAISAVAGRLTALEEDGLGALDFSALAKPYLDRR